MRPIRVLNNNELRYVSPSGGKRPPAANPNVLSQLADAQAGIGRAFASLGNALQQSLEADQAAKQGAALGQAKLEYLERSQNARRDAYSGAGPAGEGIEMLDHSYRGIEQDVEKKYSFTNETREKFRLFTGSSRLSSIDQDLNHQQALRRKYVTDNIQTSVDTAVTQIQTNPDAYRTYADVVKSSIEEQVRSRALSAADGEVQMRYARQSMANALISGVARKDPEKLGSALKQFESFMSGMKVDMGTKRMSLKGANIGNARAIANVAEKMGFDPMLAVAMSHFESAGTFSTSIRPESSRGTMVRDGKQVLSSALGSFQLLEAEHEKYGYGRDIQSQTSAAIRKNNYETAYAEKQLGRPLKLWERYVVHMQGIAGGPRILGAPKDAPLANYVSAEAISANKWTKGMTVGQYLAKAKREMTSRMEALETVIYPAAGKNADTDTAHRAAGKYQDAIREGKIPVLDGPVQINDFLSASPSVIQNVVKDLRGLMATKLDDMTSQAIAQLEQTGKQTVLDQNKLNEFRTVLGSKKIGQVETALKMGTTVAGLKDELSSKSLEDLEEWIQMNEPNPAEKDSEKFAEQEIKYKAGIAIAQDIAKRYKNDPVGTAVELSELGAAGTELINKNQGSSKEEVARRMMGFDLIREAQISRGIKNPRLLSTETAQRLSQLVIRDVYGNQPSQGSSTVEGLKTYYGENFSQVWGEIVRSSNKKLPQHMVVGETMTALGVQDLVKAERYLGATQKESHNQELKSRYGSSVHNDIRSKITSELEDWNRSLGVPGDPYVRKTQDNYLSAAESLVKYYLGSAEPGSTGNISDAAEKAAKVLFRDKYEVSATIRIPTSQASYQRSELMRGIGALHKDIRETAVNQINPRDIMSGESREFNRSAYLDAISDGHYRIYTHPNDKGVVVFDRFGDSSVPMRSKDGSLIFYSWEAIRELGVKKEEEMKRDFYGVPNNP